ncbi:unnamed protein product [Polarella glacialis]|uniref:Uncharacterized protein n=1 Tax=Polarella glacialis TaxID=89957 RepID=A0A813EH18_POLGL|nr:unnamed protein product [Polarella glacialis]
MATSNMQRYARGWQIPEVPASIRLPWRAFEEDLESKFEDASSHGCADPVLGEKISAAQAKGAQGTFMELPKDVRRCYNEVSVLEFSAYVCWQRSHAARQQNGEVPPATELDEAWDNLDCDEKAEWVPENPRAVLAEDGHWSPLLVV